MADNVTLPAQGVGTSTPVVATEDEGGVHYQKIKVVSGRSGETGPALDIVSEDVAATGGEAGILAMGIRQDTPAALGANGDFTYASFDDRGLQWVHPLGNEVTKTADVTRAANTTTYAINDNFGSTPTGGYTISDAARVSGGSGIITDAFISFEEDAATPLQGEIKLFDTAFTEVADNAAWAVSDAENKTGIGKIPFSLTDNGNQGEEHIQNLSIGFTTVGSANLRFGVKTKNGYVPTTNSSILSVRFKIIQVN